MSINYGQSFTADMLKQYIDTQKNYVFSYPAGSGKTTAIKNYLKDNYMNHSKVIYIAPTKSLLDDMEAQLLSAGIMKSLIFKYYSCSEDEMHALKRAYSIPHIDVNTDAFEQEIGNKLQNSQIILITHQRMIMESSDRFIGIFDDIDKPLVFIDEAVKPIITASINIYNLESLLRKVSLINNGTRINDIESYIWSTPTEISSHEVAVAFSNRKKLIYQALINSLPVGKGKPPEIMRPSFYGFELSEDLGIEGTAYNESTKRRLKNLYTHLASQIALCDFKYIGDSYIINVPIALQLAWRNCAQTIIMDATAEVTKPFYEGYEVISGNTLWNWDNISGGYLFHSRLLSKSKIQNNMDQYLESGSLDKEWIVPQLLDMIPLCRYRNIYMVCSKIFLKGIHQYLSKFTNVNIIWDESELLNEIDEEVSGNKWHDNDLKSDEVYNSALTSITNDNNVTNVYLSNYGKTRGSNTFRDCDCVIQVGSYRLPPSVINLCKIIYPEITDNGNGLCIANYIQELYRGKIRCGKDMHSYAIIDDMLYNGLAELYPDYVNNVTNVCNIDEDKVNAIININLGSIDNVSYGRSTFKVANLRKVISEGKYIDSNNVEVDIEHKVIEEVNGSRYIVIGKDTLKAIYNTNRWDNIKSSLVNLYIEYTELRNELFGYYISAEQLRNEITLANQIDNSVHLRLGPVSPNKQNV